MFLYILADTRYGSFINAPLAARGTVLDLHSVQKTHTAPSDPSLVAVCIDEVTGEPSSEIGNNEEDSISYSYRMFLYIHKDNIYLSVVTSSHHINGKQASSFTKIVGREPTMQKPPQRRALDSTSKHARHKKGLR